MNGANLSGFVLISILMSRLSYRSWHLGVMLAIGSGYSKYSNVIYFCIGWICTILLKCPDLSKEYGTKKQV
ncbi:hypothetical protein J2Z69_001060 [Paenibacillus shirakamiensis]|uniref:Uncharacterized protein n=1 Tax=Paenibacillus shirakamiensis TaxID=1265935 RepID=A0ABS4JG00_9BACL|nr:hypothetical protein [Paenibacillus shirakamiensis]